MKNKILTFTLERQSKDQEWGLSLVGGWMEGQWIQVSQVSTMSYLLYIYTSFHLTVEGGQSCHESGVAGWRLCGGGGWPAGPLHGAGAGGEAAAGGQAADCPHCGEVECWCEMYNYILTTLISVCRGDVAPLSLSENTVDNGSSVSNIDPRQNAANSQDVVTIVINKEKGIWKRDLQK